MIRDRLKLNDDKTEFLLLGTRQQQGKSIFVGESAVNTKPVVRNMGSWFDSQLSMSFILANSIAQLSFIYITSVVFASS